MTLTDAIEGVTDVLESHGLALPTAVIKAIIAELRPELVVIEAPVVTVEIAPGVRVTTVPAAPVDGEPFGAVLRRTRTTSGVTMGRLARALGIGVAELSDVEVGRREPLAEQSILAAAAVMGVDAGPLLAAASRKRAAPGVDLAGLARHEGGDA